MITAIVIPADSDKPLRREEVSSTDARAYRSLVGGSLQVVHLEEPAASLYVNEEGKQLDLPLNARATVLLWAHNAAFVGQDWIVGDALLVGPVGRDGADMTAPRAYVSLLLDGRYFGLAVKTAEDGEWQDLGTVFDDVFSVYPLLVTLTRHKRVKGVRVVVVS
jgi:hypothetical protein